VACWPNGSGSRAPFLVYAIGGSLGSLVAWFQIPETRDLGRAEATSAAAPLPTFGAQVRLLTGRMGFVLASLVSFVNAVARTGGLFNVIPVMARDRLLLSPEQIGFGLGLASLAGLGLAYPAGLVVDRYGRKAVIVPATLVSGASLVVFLLAPSYAWFLAGCVIWSAAISVGGAAPAAYAADVAPAGMQAAAMSTFRMLSDVGYVVGPIALGLITDLFDVNAALATTAALLGLVALLFARLAPETYRGLPRAP
jgi:MFS family permease